MIAVDANGFSRTGAAGDQQVGHFRQVGDDRVTVDILAQASGMRALVFTHSSDSSRSRMMTLVLISVGNFHAHGALARDRRENIDPLRL